MFNCNNIDPDEFKFWIVISSITQDPYGPFDTYKEAEEFAEDSDGSIFECDWTQAV